MSMSPTPPCAVPNGRYTQKEAAALLGVHPETLRRAVKAGKIQQSFAKKSLRPYFLGRHINSYWHDY